MDVQYHMGLGKAQPVSEPVLTPSGWVPIGEIQPGDRVVSATDGRPATVRSVHPQQSSETYRVTFNDGTWTRCNIDHLWTVGRWSTGRQVKWETLSLRQILDKGVRETNGGTRWMIPMTHPVQADRVDLPVEPYALGVILGDGQIKAQGNVTIHSDREVLESIHPGGRALIAPAPGCWRLNSSHWMDDLSRLGLAGKRSHEKFVPDIYLRAPEGDRRALLAGLLDTDGTPMDKGGVEFTSTSLALVEAVAELAESLGGTARWKRHGRVTRYTHNGEYREGKRSWRVNVKVPVNPFRLTRKADAWIEPTKYPVRRRIASVERVEDEANVCIKIDREDGLYLTRSHIVTHNTVISMAVAAMLWEDGLLDQVLIVAEANKVRDWADEDFPAWTTMTTGRYMGPRRERLLEDPPQVLVTTYETGRLDAAVFKHARKSKGWAITGPGPLAEFLADRRTLIVFDEETKLRGRSSRVHIAWSYLVNRWLAGKRKNRPMILGLTGTKMESRPEDHYNVNRVTMLPRSPLVKTFERDYHGEVDEWGTVKTYRNLDEATCEPGVTPLSLLYADATIRKRKSDPDVIGHFPAKMENPSRFVPLGKMHRDFYDTIVDVLGEEQINVGMGLLRQIAAAPEALLASKGEMSKAVVAEVGANALRKMGSAKIDETIRWLEEGGDQQSVIFTFYGQSVLPVLHERLREEGYAVSLCHGQMSSAARQTSQNAYKAGETQVFLSSDAGARGLNLGVGSLLLHFEMPLLAAIYHQRSDRIHRANSTHPSVTIDSLIAKDTIEEHIWELVLKRDAWAEAVEDNSEPSDGTEFGYLTSSLRKTLWQRARAR